MMKGAQEVGRQVDGGNHNPEVTVQPVISSARNARLSTWDFLGNYEKQCKRARPRMAVCMMIFLASNLLLTTLRRSPIQRRLAYMRMRISRLYISLRHYHPLNKWHRTSWTCQDSLHFRLPTLATTLPAVTV